MSEKVVRREFRFVQNGKFGEGNRLGRRHRQIVDSDLLLDVRFVLRTSTGAFSCQWLKGAACWSNLSTLARSGQASDQRSRVLAAILASMEC
jgi:hypothetical protein